MNKNGQMALFSLLAYYDFNNPSIEDLQTNVKNMLLSVKDDLEFTDISWGPIAYKKFPEKRSDSLIYAVRASAQNFQGSSVPEYTIVIRGTNPFSISSWLFQDLDVSGLTPWARQSENTKAKFAYISKATDTSLAIHKNLADNGVNILSWILGLIANSSIKLNITGHSLGGLMSTTFALWLYDELVFRNMVDKVDMSIYAFAGPTAGNREFAEYLKEKMSTKYICFENDKDVATQVWDENNMVNVLPIIYKPIMPDEFESKMLNYLTSEILKLQYTKIGNIEKVRSFIYDKGIFQDYLMQAVYQHVIPYAIFAFVRAPRKTIDIVITIIKNLIFGIEEWGIEGKTVKLNDSEKEEMFGAIRAELLSHENEWGKDK